jgi:hypothetical protein
MQKFERGELSLFPFYERFGCELSDTENGNKWYMEYCARKKIGTTLYISVMFFLNHLDSGCPPLPVKLEVDGREVSAMNTCLPTAPFTPLPPSNAKAFW